MRPFCHHLDGTARGLAVVVQSGAPRIRWPNARNPSTLGREEAAVQARSAELRQELSIWDLAFAQILFIVGLQWVGVAAKQGPSHVIFWLIAIVLFYLPSAAVAVWLNRAMPLEGGLYQWAKLGFNELMGFIVAWNLWLFAILNMTNVGLQFTQYLGYIFGPRVAASHGAELGDLGDDGDRDRRADRGSPWSGSASASGCTPSAAS